MRSRGPVQGGRGARSNRSSRYLETRIESVDDGWRAGPDVDARNDTEATPDSARRVISRNRSPDIPFDQSINPYRGCEHGCVYCFARPTHAWLGLSPGLDFERRLFFKSDAARLLEAELQSPGYRCSPIALGVNTDAYQPLERRMRITRAILQTLLRFGHPVQLITKSAGIERDIDLLSELAGRQLVQVRLSITTLDRRLSRAIEPRASSPRRRLQAIEVLAGAGVPVGVAVAPVIPGLTDPDLESILQQARDCGAGFCDWSLLRLPLEVRDLFVEWLQAHCPDRASRVMSLLRDARGGQDNDSRFGTRMRGVGVIADLIGQRFDAARRRLGYAEPPALSIDSFRVPGSAQQLVLL